VQALLAAEFGGIAINDRTEQLEQGGSGLADGSKAARTLVEASSGRRCRS